MVCDTSWTDVLTAIGTVGAVVVALFGQFLGKLMPPRLQIRMASLLGTPQRMQIYNNTGPYPVYLRDAEARYYLLEVSNGRRWAKAHHVRVMLLQIEEEHPTVGWKVSWSGSIPMKWQHQETMGGVRNIGPRALADLFHVMHDTDPTGEVALQLTPTFGPFGVELRYNRQCVLRLTLQAQSDESDSELLAITIRWDGKWHDGTVEMGQHLRIEVGDKKG